MPKTVRFVALALAMLALSHAPLWACSCGRSGPARCAGLGQENVIFVGTVLDIENPPSEDPKVGDSGISRYRFRIDENFRGAPGSAIDIFSGRGGADCSYHFQKGAQYLVFGYKAKPTDDPYASSCSDTQPVKEAKALLPQLRAMRDGTKVASLFGRLNRTQQPYLATRDDSFNRPLTNTIVQVQSGHKIFKAKTDADGVFAFYDLPAGEYRVTAAVPEGLEIAQTILSDPVPPLPLPAGACYEYDVDALPTGRIRGQVLKPDGTPVHSGSVELFRVDKYDEKTSGWWEYQGDERSGFEFLHVAPGDYLLVFNNPNRLDPDAPFPRTFYSSSPQASSAQVIHLTEGEQLLGADIHVSGGRPTRNITVLLKWEGKKPSEDTVFVSARGSDGTGPFAERVKSGVYHVTLLRDAHYILKATIYCQSCHENGCGPAREWSTADVEVDGADDRTSEVTLTFPPGGCAKK